MRGLARARRGGGRAEAGFTLVEVMVAITILAIALFATVDSLVRASKASLEAQRHEQAIAIAQREIEKLRLVPYAELGLTLASVPSNQPSGGGTNPKNPDFYVVDGPPKRFRIKQDYHNSASGSVAGVDPAGERLVQGGTVEHMSSFSVGATTGKVYRYVTYRNEVCGSPDACPTDADSKRVTVAVVLDPAANGAGPDRPVYVSTVVTQPEP